MIRVYIIAVVFVLALGYTTAKIRVAVIGGGIGGASTAFYLNNLTLGNARAPKIVAFERRDYIGGRLKHEVRRIRNETVVCELVGEFKPCRNQSRLVSRRSNPHSPRRRRVVKGQLVRRGASPRALSWGAIRKIRSCERQVELEERGRSRL